MPRLNTNLGIAGEVGIAPIRASSVCDHWLREQRVIGGHAAETGPSTGELDLRPTEFLTQPDGTCLPGFQTGRH